MVTELTNSLTHRTGHKVKPQPEEEVGGERGEVGRRGTRTEEGWGEGGGGERRAEVNRD